MLTSRIVCAAITRLCTQIALAAIICALAGPVAAQCVNPPDNCPPCYSDAPPRPTHNGTVNVVPSFPKALAAGRLDKALTVELLNGKLTLVVHNYESGFQWFPRLKKAGCIVEDAIINRGYPRFSVVALATFEPPRHMDIPDEIGWDPIGPSAGLPSLGRRR